MGCPICDPATGATVTTATLTCPRCGAASRVVMPTDACQFFFDCPVCEALLRPLPGDCCVFCSYADVPCPPRQGTPRTAGPQSPAARVRDQPGAAPWVDRNTA